MRLEKVIVMLMKFSKYEGAGNDFIVIDARDTEFNLPAEMIAQLCDRHKGIGADGLMALEMTAGKLDFKMRYYNSDGYEGTMCGNGGRCITLFAHYLGLGHKEKVFEGIDGIHHAKLLSDDDNTGIVELQMIDVNEIEEVIGGYLLNTGSPHFIRFVEDVDKVDVFNEGRKLRYDKHFDKCKGVNVNFVQIIGDGEFKIRTYERGVENETLACGTGATASAIATKIKTASKLNSFHIHAQGGDLKVRFNESDKKFTSVYLTGPARRVFEGKFETSNYKG